jgi:uncharacterized protein YwgA
MGALIDELGRGFQLFFGNWPLPPYPRGQRSWKGERRMNARQIAVKLLLDHLNIPSDITTFDDRKRVQKAIYLSQRAGVGLGYRFGWYLKGPYSADLTGDYFALARDLATGRRDHEDQELTETVQEQLQTIQPILERPKWFHRPLEDWLELVASLDYLLQVRRLDIRKAQKVFENEKPALKDYVSRARQELRKTRLVK